MNTDTKAREREMSIGILRQRRNLIGISILLPIYLASGVTLKNISILGTSLELQDPKIITSFLVILFFYFLLRYTQYFNEETYVRESRHKLKSFQNSYIIKYIEKTISKKFKKMDNSYIKRINYYDYGGNISFCETDSLFYKPISVDLSLNKEDAENPHHFLKTDTQWKLVKRDQNSNIIYSSSDYERYSSEITINSIICFYQKSIAFLRFILTSSAFTDYYLPLIIWLVSFIYLAYYYITKI